MYSLFISFEYRHRSLIVLQRWTFFFLFCVVLNFFFLQKRLFWKNLAKKKHLEKYKELTRTRRLKLISIFFFFFCVYQMFFLACLYRMESKINRFMSWNNISMNVSNERKLRRDGQNDWDWFIGIQFFFY